MPTLDTIHPELCSRFIYAQLAANATLVSIHKSRFYDERSRPNSPAYPYIYWNGVEKQVVDHSWRGGEYIAKMVSEYNVRSVRSYPQGNWSGNDFAATFQALREALTGNECTAVMVGSTTIGTVYQSRYLRRYDRSYRDGDILLVESGVTIEIVHK